MMQGLIIRQVIGRVVARSNAGVDYRKWFRWSTCPRYRGQQMSQEIAHGYRTARKQHQCFHCYRKIAKGDFYYYQTVVGDYIETLKMHRECEKFAWAYIKICGYTYYDFTDGYPPTYDLIMENLSPPELDDLFNSYRGFYPHVITRMEHNIQDQEIRYNNWVAGGRK